MARGEEPLFTQRPSSVHESDMAEEDALLTGQPTGRSMRQARWSRWKDIGLFAWALLATAAVIVLAVVFQHQSSGSSHTKHGHGHGHGHGHDHGHGHGDKPPGGKRNLIFMVSDGMGPTSLSLTRSFRQYVDALPYGDALVLDDHLIGQSRTRSSSSLVTDSAAGATAFSCGMKSYNGAISVLPDFTPCGSIMEAAKRAGYTTGLVVTTRITDATPACFASHARRREMEDQIANQLIGNGPLGRTVDLILGGGRCHFLPNTTEGSCRADDENLLKQAEKNGWNYISTRNDFDALETGDAVELPLLGLFAPTDIPFEIDRRFVDDIYPSLPEMATTSLNALRAATKDSDKGFFIMIEGSRIDHAGHANDPAAQVHEVLAYDRTIQAVLDFLEQDDTEGVMISTSDHETGGLAAARQLQPTYPEYLWHPAVLANASHSAEYTTLQYAKHLSSRSSHEQSASHTKKYLKDLISNSLGIHDPSEEELNTLVTSPITSAYTFADMISRRSQTGWSTHGHSAVDVNIYTSDAHAAQKLRGNHENTEVGEFLRWYLELEDEVEEVTKVLRESLEVLDGGESWLGAVPMPGERLDGQDHVDHYHGDFKM